MSRLLQLLQESIRVAREPEPSTASEERGQVSISQRWWDDASEVPWIEVPPEHKAASSASAGVQSSSQTSEAHAAAQPLSVSPAEQIPVGEASFFQVRELGRDAALPHDHMQAYQTAATALWHAVRQRAVKSLLMLPVGMVDATAASLSLCCELVSAGCQPLVVIDVRPGRGTLPELLNRSATPGWLEILAGLSVRFAIQESGVSGVHLIGPGTSSLVVDRQRMWNRAAKALDDLRCLYELSVVIGETWHPPRLPGPWIYIVQATVVLAAKAEQGGDRAAEAVALLAEQRVPVLGSILVPTGPPPAPPQAAAR